jgi:hypothetical protein
MKGILFTLAMLSFSSLFAQDAPVLAFPPGVEIRNTTPQELADAISKAVREHPQKAAMVVRQAMGAINNADGKFSEIEKKRAAAIVSAAVAAAPGLNPSAIIAAGAGEVPALSAVVLQAADSVTTNKTRSTEGESPSGMLLGNIRVQEVEGNGVKLVDSNGKTSGLKRGDFLREGVRVVTGPEGSAVLIFENGSLIRVNPNTEFAIEKFQQDPFSSQGLDYCTIENEPSRSITRTSLLKGEVSFDVATLKKNSTYEIVTPVGIAGIRGTGGFVKSMPKNQRQAASFGLFEGSATFTTASGQTQAVIQNQAIGINGPNGNFAINLNPSDGETSLVQSKQQMSQSQLAVPTNPFIGAPPPQAAPAGPISSLTDAQQLALQQAASEGSEAVAEAALQLAMQSPEAAAEIAIAATDLTPSAAITIAITFSATFPSESALISSALSFAAPVLAPCIASMISISSPLQATAIAAATASVVPDQASIVAAWVGFLNPLEAPSIAAAVASTIPLQASSIAATVAGILPAQAAEIAAAVSRALPNQAASIAFAVAAAVPNEAPAISSAVISAAPAQSSAILAAVDSAESNTPGSGFGDFNGQNIGILPTPTPTPTPRLPTSTPPPVSPSA